MLKKLILSLFVLSSITVTAQQTVDLSITVPETAPYKEINVSVVPAHLSFAPESAVSAVRNGDVFTASVPECKEGIYFLYVSNREMQLRQPLYFDNPGAKKFSLTEAKELSTVNDLADNENRAFSAYAEHNNEISRRLSKNVENLSGDRILAALSEYKETADSLSAAYSPAEPVRQYLSIWSYISARDAFSTVAYLKERMGKSLDFKPADFLPETHKVLDTPMAAWFYSTPLTIVGSLKGKTTEEKLEDLLEKYSTPGLVAAAKSILVNRFLSRYDYVNDFDNGLARITAMTERYDLPKETIANFESRRAAIPGAPFPTVRLEDREGNLIDFSNYAGKYVYIDLWASWCGPCIREVPHLKKLEQQLKDASIEFVSISSDTDRNAWISRMDALKLEGHQLIDVDGTLCDKLNINGIPRFLLYGPDGKLISHNMTRPSDAKTLQTLQNLN